MNMGMPMILAWYDREDWEEWMKLCPGEMCDSWDQWNASAEKLLQKANHDRQIVHISTIRPLEFKFWAEKNQRPLNGYSRSEYAGELMKDAILPKPPLPSPLPSQREINRLLRKALEKNPKIDLPSAFTPYLRRPEASICPLFREDSAGKIEQFGSSVLLKIANVHFLLSAAHVFDEFKNYEILIPGKDHLIALNGAYSTTKIPKSGSRQDDTLDLGFFVLEQEINSHLDAALLFLEEPDVDPLDETTAGDAYTVMGYPSDKSRSIGGKAETEMFRITGEGIQDHRYRDKMLDPLKQILIQYRPRKAINSTTMLQPKKLDFGGMSGCGVFAWSKSLPETNYLEQPKLVGILTEYDPHRNVFVASRIHSIIAAIHKDFPDLPIL